MSETVPISFAENTAFTSLLVGVFLNSPLITSDHMKELYNINMQEQYGRSFQQSLNVFSQKRPVDQIYFLHKLQR